MTGPACAWWVVTDLDGTLMDDHYDWTPAESVIRWLQSLAVPVIPCTSKTAEEVRLFVDRQACGTLTSWKTAGRFMEKMRRANHGSRPSDPAGES